MKRVVVTSSISAITPSPNWPADVVKNEDCWTDVEYCQKKGVKNFDLTFLNLVQVLMIWCSCGVLML